jgi:hypothetical protein
MRALVSENSVYFEKPNKNGGKLLNNIPTLKY